ncbi:class I SAM-dependent methyltransferase [Fluviicola taffensis]|uniref:Ribosomal RNA adenine methylase transferase n=1 Tax=Fluviicola taffensis (strain DSM 16823 / NCIMB 13979 / RW262) TaxID=755732 RepID=F2ICF6_FLUTR|nr:rRNA adenine N-6-methyltransferase family protein [Fluviicola taffensis]AEA45426.1 ribosomal RNA adenine methylase transferase [Fluviicola taffensis DSM 16823]
MSDKRSFLRNFWKERKMVGAMAPSSKYLAKKMLEKIDFSTAKVIVELGPGTGVFTRKILANLSPDGILLVFELNDSFMNMLRKEFSDPRVILIHDSAEKIGEYLEKYGYSQADAVISSLPLANFPSDLKNRILTESHRVMHQDAVYVQFQYSLNAKKAIKQFYKQVEISFTPANFPPAFVYYCKK